MVMRSEKAAFSDLTKVKDEIFSIIILGIKEHHKECAHKECYLPYSHCGIIWQHKHCSEY
jgi:hypothetical protein